MRKFWLLGALVLAAGLALVFTARYINQRVNAGREEVAEGQEQIDQSTELFSMTPFTDPVGKALSAPEQNEVNQGQAEVNYYAQVASKYSKWAIIILIVGAVLVALGFIRKRRSR